MKSFTDRVYAVVKKIPKGQTLTYKEVARMAGRPRAYRAVGNILNNNFDQAIPCHRVVRSDGNAGGYNRGAQRKQKLLIKEKALSYVDGKLNKKGVQHITTAIDVDKTGTEAVSFFYESC